MTDPTCLGLAEAASLIRSRELSAAELVEAYLGRIDALEIHLRAWARIDRSGALEAASRVDEELARGGARGALHGLPVGIKDVYRTAGLETSAGSKILAGSVPRRDATAVGRLKATGAIVLGKTACTEFAANDPAPTRNPWNPYHTPGGSSSGSAAAVAARVCPATLDTQTAGDVVRPAAYCGIVGLKPTYGLISRHNSIPVAWSVDTAGVLVRSVEDAALMLGALAGHDPLDPSSSSRPVPDYEEALEGQLEPPRLGIVRGYFHERATDEVSGHVERVAQLLERVGARIEQVTIPEDLLERSHAAHRVIVFSECAAYHQETFSKRPDDYGPKIRQLVELGLATPAVSYLQAQRLRRRFGRKVSEALEGLDALIIPSTPAPAPEGLRNTGDRRFQIPWTLAGVPVVALPTGLSQEGLPWGVQLVGSTFGENRLLAAARWCEEVLGVELVPDLG